MTQLADMGIAEVVIEETHLPGIHLNLMLDMKNEIVNNLGM
jgi:hypothetical protein